MTEMRDDKDSVRKALFAMSPEKYRSGPSHCVMRIGNHYMVTVGPSKVSALGILTFKELNTELWVPLLPSEE